MTDQLDPLKTALADRYAIERELGSGRMAARSQPATGDAWFLVNAGYRLEAMPQEPGQALNETDRLLTEWIETDLLAPASRA